MRERVMKVCNSIKELVRLEQLLSYPIISIIGLLGAMSILSGLATKNTVIEPFLFGWDIGSPFEGAEDVQRYLEYFSSRRGFALIRSFSGCLIGLSFLIPLIISFNLSKSFEDGTMRTILSYPVERTQYLTTKSSILILISFLVPLFSSIFWIYFWYPMGTGIEYFWIVSVSFFVSLLLIISSMILLSIITRSISKTALIGMSSWGILTFMSQTGSAMSLEVLQIISPLKVAEMYLIGWSLDLSLIDVGVSVITAFGLSLLFLFMAIYLFKRLEV